MPTLDRADLLRRAHGALLGVAIGDAMGAPVEGRSAAEIRAAHGRITGFLTDAAAGTDDTDFTLFNAYLLTTHGRAITPAQVEAEWRDKLLAPGRAYRPGGFSDVCSTRNLAAGLAAPQSGLFNHQMWSDGVAMAISPAGILAAGDPDLAARLAAALGAVSNGRDGIFAAQAVAAAIAVALTGAAPAEMLAAARAVVPAGSWTARTLQRAAETAAALPADPLTGTGLDAALVRLSERLVVPWWPWADLVTEAVPLAFGAFLAARGEFRRAVPAGVSLGRDADTIGAIVGSLAGAYGGRDAIPDDWARRAAVSAGKCIGFVAGLEIETVAAQLVDRALAGGAE
jgi:ADP-ribosylglycohydrolase